MTVFCGGVGPTTFWSFHTGDTSNEEWDTYLATFESAVRAGCTHLLTVTYNSTPPNAVQRKILAEQVNRYRLHKHAFVARSAVVRAVLTMLEWTTTKHHVERMFARPIEGIEWLMSDGAVSAAEVIESIRTGVPDGLLHPDLRPG
ncbi:MAG: hypothetical protein AB8I08_15255 [Sandaracinaceae bacterium]